MKGLLLKDAYQIWHYAKGVIVAAVVMMGAGVVTIMNGANFFIVYAGFLMGMMPMTLLAYDQASKFSEDKWPLAFELLNNCGGENHEGFIGMQDHGDDVWFRNIRVKVLD